MTGPLFKKFDVVQILSVKNVKFVSGPKNRPASPHGNWSVVGFVKSDLMLAKDSTIALVPPDAVRKIAAYDLDGFLNNQKGIGHGQKIRGIKGKEESNIAEGSGKKPK